MCVLCDKPIKGDTDIRAINLFRAAHIHMTLPSELPNMSSSNLTGKRKEPATECDAKKNPPINFKASINGPFRKLSNLYGPVEWEFQMEKFKPGSEVHEWLSAGLKKEMEGGWSLCEFEAALKGMKHGGKASSYITPDGQIASGLLAQMTSIIAKTKEKNPENPLARNRLAHIMGRATIVPTEEAKLWRCENIMPELKGGIGGEKWDVMLKLLQKKYDIPQYRDLLLATNDRPLHEIHQRGFPGDWVYFEPNAEQKAKGWLAGGDWLGKLLMEVRSEKQADRQCVTMEMFKRDSSICEEV